MVRWTVSSQRRLPYSTPSAWSGVDIAPPGWSHLSGVDMARQGGLTCLVWTWPAQGDLTCLVWIALVLTMMRSLPEVSGQTLTTVHHIPQFSLLPAGHDLCGLWGH